MDGDKTLYRTWVRMGIYAGLAVSVIYPLMIFAPLPKKITIILASLFGPLLMLASLGLYYFLKAHRKTVTGQLAVISNIVASVLVTLMLIVQLSVNLSISGLMDSAGEGISEATKKWIWQVVDKVQLGMDVSWDIFIAIGTILFGVTMMKHPRFGKIFGLLGFLIGHFLLVFNLSTFPTPPGDAGLIDLGPFAGIWYLLVTVQIIRSLKWFDQQRI
ncbi:MAG: hypothetical protein JSV17_10365 [Candidatus Aminicenantes bacterium]|nr:MAG: hypothetical protein JSV17_10365 [Candidatus Aminicenantes bacterium]